MEACWCVRCFGKRDWGVWGGSLPSRLGRARPTHLEIVSSSEPVSPPAQGLSPFFFSLSSPWRPFFDLSDRRSALVGCSKRFFFLLLLILPASWSASQYAFCLSIRCPPTQPDLSRSHSLTERQRRGLATHTHAHTYPLWLQPPICCHGPCQSGHTLLLGMAPRDSTGRAPGIITEQASCVVPSSDSPSTRKPIGLQCSHRANSETQPIPST